GALLLGTWEVFRDETLWVRWNAGQQAALVVTLERLHATRIYTDYWSCDRIAFQSRERIVCAVLDDELRTGQNRVPGYVAAVSRAAEPAYAFPAGSPQAHELPRRLGRRYRR